MSTTTESPERGTPNRVTAMGHERFIDRHRLQLLRFLEGDLQDTAYDRSSALDCVEYVLEEWHKHFDKVELAEANAVERTFWYGLYLFEELTEAPAPLSHPYQKLMLENLKEVRGLLHDRLPLPEDRFMATRPDGT